MVIGKLISVVDDKNVSISEELTSSFRRIKRGKLFYQQTRQPKYHELAKDGFLFISLYIQVGSENNSSTEGKAPLLKSSVFWYLKILWMEHFEYKT